jgi:hypothetical protein
LQLAAAAGRRDGKEGEQPPRNEENTTRSKEAPLHFPHLYVYKRTRRSPISNTLLRLLLFPCWKLHLYLDGQSNLEASSTVHFEFIAGCSP